MSGRSCFLKNLSFSSLSKKFRPSSLKPQKNELFDADLELFDWL